MNPNPSNEASSITPVLIVGSGPTGLVLALWLTKLGIRVRIIDQAAESGTTSRALVIHARTLEFYHQIGIADRVVQEGIISENWNLWINGEKRAHFPLKEMGKGLSPYPYVLIFPQDEHEKLLIDELGKLGVTVERNTELLDFHQDHDQVRAQIKKNNGEIETLHALYLAGCDGAKSTVRKTLHLNFAGSTYEHLFYVADVEATKPSPNEDINIHFNKTDFMLLFPLKGKNRLRLVGTVQNVEHPTFENVSDFGVKQMKLNVSKVNWFSTYHVHHRLSEKFHDGRVFLLGDAAHIHSPVGGQGMNTGIGDAVNLSWKLASVLQGKASPHLLDTYEVERIAFAKELVSTTDRAFVFTTKKSWVAEKIRTVLLPFFASKLIRFRFFTEMVFKRGSQIRIRYPQSRLSSGSSRNLKGGDRLPWTRDNFVPLKSLSWQVHLYGKQNSGMNQTCKALEIELHILPWNAHVEKAGIVKNCMYLIRPDGYIALIDEDSDPDRLMLYFKQQVSDTFYKKAHINSIQ